MRNIRFIILSILLLTGCEKPVSVSEHLMELCEPVLGQYKCKSITLLEGKTVDLDADGIASSDIMSELKRYSFCMGILNSQVKVRPVSRYNDTTRIYFSIPIQGLKYDKLSERVTTYDDLELSLIGTCCIVDFLMFVTEKDQLSFVPEEQPNKPYSETNTKLYYWEVPYVKPKSISFDPGTMTIIVDGMYYDFATESLVQAPVEYEYERVSFDYR